MRGHTQAQNKWMEEDLPSKSRAKKAGVAILVSHEIGFKLTKVKRNPSHMQGYTKAQNKGMKEDLPS